MQGAYVLLTVCLQERTNSASVPFSGHLSNTAPFMLPTVEVSSKSSGPISPFKCRKRSLYGSFSVPMPSPAFADASIRCGRWARSAIDRTSLILCLQEELFRAEQGHVASRGAECRLFQATAATEPAQEQDKCAQHENLHDKQPACPECCLQQP